MMLTDEEYMKMAIDLAKKGMKDHGGGPFGAIVVDANGNVIGRGFNQVTPNHDPTAHAEVMAIRDACQNLGHFQLTDCTIYSSCEPCPMCLGAIYWARPKRIVFACTREDAAAIGFDDDFLYKEMKVEVHQRTIPTEQLSREEALNIFNMWKEKGDKIEY